VQVTTQAAKGEVFFKALHAVNASVTPAVKDAARHAHAVLLAAIERIEAKKVKRRKEREAAEAATKRAKMTPASGQAQRRQTFREKNRSTRFHPRYPREGYASTEGATTRTTRKDATRNHGTRRRTSGSSP
jgi:hypothetical protein